MKLELALEMTSFQLNVLAEAELNVREIRNAISTARQLASFRCKPLGYEHLRTVIDEAQKFEDYLKDLRHGFTDDELRRDQMER